MSKTDDTMKTKKIMLNKTFAPLDEDPLNGEISWMDVRSHKLAEGRFEAYEAMIPSMEKKVRAHFKGRPNTEKVREYVTKPFWTLIPSSEYVDYKLGRAVATVLHELSGGEYPLDGRAASQKYHDSRLVNAPEKKKPEPKSSKTIAISDYRSEVDTLKAEVRRLKGNVKSIKYYYHNKRAEDRATIKKLKAALKEQGKPVEIAQEPAPAPIVEPVVEQPKGFWSKLFGG